MATDLNKRPSVVEAINRGNLAFQKAKSPDWLRQSAEAFKADNEEHAKRRAIWNASNANGGLFIGV